MSITTLEIYGDFLRLRLVQKYLTNSVFVFYGDPETLRKLLVSFMTLKVCDVFRGMKPRRTSAIISEVYVS